MKAMTKKLIVFGYGQRGSIYASYAAAYPEQFEPKKPKSSILPYRFIPILTM